MRRLSLVFAVCAAVALSVSLLPAQEMTKIPTETEYAQVMKDIQAAQQSLKKSVDAKTPAEGAADAAKLHASFMQVQAFWNQRKVEDAVKAAGDAVAAATKAAAAAKAANAEELQAAYTAMGATCRTCHTAHRERLPDGSYRIK